MRAGFQSIRDRFDGVDDRFDGVNARFDRMDARFAGVDVRLARVEEHLVEHDARFESVETRVANSEADTRRHFVIVADSLRADLKVVIDETTATDKKLDRLSTSNAIEHAAILEAVTDHEVRITAIEKTRADRD